MTKAKNRPAKVSGAVLIMILAVMTVLIILLAGSIAVVYSTHERVAKKYQESQAYYTMRSTLSVCMDNIIMNTDSALSSQEVYYYTGGSDPIKKLSGNVAADQLKRGRYEELVLYQVPISTDTTNSITDPNPNYNKWYADKGFTNESMVNITDGDFTSLSFTGDTTDLAAFKKQYVAGAWTSSMKKGEDDTITFTIDKDSIANMAVDTTSGNKVTKMLDTDLTSDTIVVKLQVLERQYDLVGTGSFGQRFLNGDRAKDYFKIKATCEMYIDGEKQTYSVIYSTKEPDPNNIGVSSLSSINPGAAIRIVGEANSLSNINYKFDNDSYTTDNVTLFGDFEANASGSKFVLENGKVMLVTGTVNLDAKPSNVVFAETGGTIVCKNLSLLSQPILTTSTAQGNIVCSNTYSIGWQGGTDPMNIRVIADTLEYTFNNPPTNILNKGPNYYNDVIIHSVSNATNNNYFSVSGNTIYYKSGLNNLLGNCTIAGDLVLYYDDDGNWLTPEVELTRYSVGDGSYTLTADPSLSTPVTITNSSDRISADYSSIVPDSSGKKLLTLPANAKLAGSESNTLELKTQKSIFSERFLDGSWDADGNFTQLDETWLWSRLNPRDSMPTVTATSLPAGGTIQVPKDPTDPGGDKEAKTFSHVITKDTGVLQLSGSYGGTIAFDTTDGDISVIFKNHVYGDFYVVGQNKLRIYLDADGGTYQFSETNDSAVFSLTDYNTINVSDGSINMVGGNKPYGPKTQIYVCDNGSNSPLVSKMVINNQTSSQIICAQIDAPKTNFEVSGADGGMPLPVPLSSGYTMPAMKFSVLGSVFANKVDMGQKRAIWSMDSPNPPGNKTVNLEERYRD